MQSGQLLCDGEWQRGMCGVKRNVGPRWRIIILFVLCLTAWTGVAVQASNPERAKYYQRQAEYYQKQAERHCEEVAYCLKLATRNQKEAAYYTKQGDIGRAETYAHKASRYVEKYEAQLKYAKRDDEKAADYLRKAANALE